MSSRHLVWKGIIGESGYPYSYRLIAAARYSYDSRTSTALVRSGTVVLVQARKYSYEYRVRFWRLGVQMRFLGHALSLRQLVGVPRLALLFPLLVLLV